MTEIYSRNDNEWIISLNKKHLIIRNFNQGVRYKNFSSDDRDKWISVSVKINSPYLKVADTKSEMKTIIKTLFRGKDFEEFE
jgi:hypothetical protein